MDIALFQTRLRHTFPHVLYRPIDNCETRNVNVANWTHITGMTSVKVARLLNLLYGMLPPEESYLEIGCLRGKTLIAAMLDNPPRHTYACDNFSEFSESGDPADDEAQLRANLAKFGLENRVCFYNGDMADILERERLIAPIGVYFYDGAHDQESHHRALRIAEPSLANEAIVLIDDWEMEGVYEATISAMEASEYDWEILQELPSHGVNADNRAMTWWNGIAILAFRRQPKRPATLVW